MDAVAIDRETPLPPGTKLKGSLFVDGTNKGTGKI